MGYNFELPPADEDIQGELLALIQHIFYEYELVALLAEDSSSEEESEESAGESDWELPDIEYNSEVVDSPPSSPVSLEMWVEDPETGEWISVWPGDQLYPENVS